MERIYQQLTFLLLACCAIFAARLDATSADLRQATLHSVYVTCNDSRISWDVSEMECDELQATTDSEFLCQARNMDPANHCWVEDKRL